MKKLLLFTLLLPAIVSGKNLELSVKAGLLGNNVKEGDWGKCAGLSGTLGFGTIRLGLSISSYSYSFKEYYYNGYTGYNYTSRMGPFVPIEFLLLNRFGNNRFLIDFGITGGTCMDTYITSEGITYTRQGEIYESKISPALVQFIGGFASVLQYNISKRLAAGVELQAKKLFYQGGSHTLYPIMARVSVRL